MEIAYKVNFFNRIYKNKLNKYFLKLCLFKNDVLSQYL